MWEAIQAVFVVVLGLVFMGALLGCFTPQDRYEWPGDERGEPFRDSESTEKE